METKKLIGGLLAGAAIGVAVGILLAPRSGQETQNKIVKGSKRLADDLRNKVGSSVDSVKNQYNNAVDNTARKGREAVSNLSDGVKA